MIKQLIRILTHCSRCLSFTQCEGKGRDSNGNIWLCDSCQLKKEEE